MNVLAPKNKKAYELLSGIGIEIGALDKPFELNATTLRVDFKSKHELERQYRNDPDVGEIADIHIIGRGDDLPCLADGAFDFVCNSHVFEHLCNPGRAVGEWLRILRPGGRIYMVVPDMRYCFDRLRELTTIEHLIRSSPSMKASNPIEFR